MKIYFYPCPDEIQSINVSKKLLPHNHYYFNLIKALKKFEEKDPEQSDFFFVPVNLIKFQFEKKCPGSYIEMLPFLGKKPHLLFASGDFGQRKKSIYENHGEDRAYPHVYQWLDDRFILLAFESTTDLLSQDIPLLPYVLKDGRLFFHRKIRRDLLFSFVGTLSYPELPKDHIRGGVLRNLINKEDCFIGTAQAAMNFYGKRKGSIVTMFERSLFSLCPAGYGRWTFRLCEALLYGAIPVILSDGYQLPFSDKIPWEKISLRFIEKDLAKVPEQLALIDNQTIDMYQKNLRKYAHFSLKKGAHSLLIQNLMDRRGLIL